MSCSWDKIALRGFWEVGIVSVRWTRPQFRDTLPSSELEADSSLELDRPVRDAISLCLSPTLLPNHSERHEFLCLGVCQLDSTQIFHTFNGGIRTNRPFFTCACKKLCFKERVSHEQDYTRAILPPSASATQEVSIKDTFPPFFRSVLLGSRGGGSLFTWSRCSKQSLSARQLAVSATLDDESRTRGCGSLSDWTIGLCKPTASIHPALRVSAGNETPRYRENRPG